MNKDAHPLADARVRGSSAPADFAGAEERFAGETAMRRRWQEYVLGALAAICAGAAAYSSYVLSPRLLERVTDDWSWRSNFVGHSREPDPNGSGFGPSTVSHYIREMKVEGAGPMPNTVRIIDDYTLIDATTGMTIWRYTTHPLVDRKTGARAELEYRGEFFLFPPNVQRTVYVLRQSYLDGYPLHFLKEETIEGLKVYIFEYIGDAEYTRSYVGSGDYPGVKVEPGQEIKCADDVFYIRIWVEPFTGSTLKIAEGCESGDYVFDMATGARLKPVLVWWGETEGPDVLRHVERARNRRLRIIAGLYLTPVLAGLAFIFGTAALIRRRKNA
jgi:hypothetical protein